MGAFSMWHWIVLLGVVVLLFGGRGKISGVMGDVAHGIRNFREGLKDPNDQSPPSLQDGGRDSAEIKKKEEIRS